MKIKNNLLLLILFTFSYVLFFGDFLYCQEYEVVQLTNNSYYDWYPRIHNGQVVWYGWDGHDYEIFLYNGSTTTQLTNNNYDDNRPQIHNGQVVWEGYDGGDYEIFLYNGSTTTQLTNNSYYDSSPQIHNGQVVWEEYDGNDEEIFLYNGITTIQLTNSGWDPQIHNGQVVWEGYDGGDYEIFLYNGSTTTQLTNNSYNEWRPQIHNGQVVWEGYDGNDYEIFFFNGTSTLQLTNNNYDDYDYQIHNGQVVWTEYDGGDYEIFLYNGSTTTQLTNNSYNDWDPQIHNGQVVWTEYDGGDYEIFLYNGSTTTQLTNNSYNDYDPQIHNGQVVWYSWYDDDFEIFLAMPKTIITISVEGTIHYENKIFNETGGGDPNATELKPVRFAKIEIVRDPDNTVLGTTETKEDGTYNLEIETGLNDRIRLRCFAHQDNADYKIIVLPGDSEPAYFGLSDVKTVKADNLIIDLDITEASGKGGAFNIFDCLVEGTKKVKELSGSVPPLLRVYWEEGTYRGTGYNNVNNYIGLNGATNDPDEYDDSVILDEYSHFIMDKFSFDKSPGGVYQANDTNQDIRLSWSEGWAIFFQGLCRNNPVYLDICKENGQWVANTLNIETLFHRYHGSLLTTATGQDTEIAVSAILWDIFDKPTGDDDPLGLGSQYIWNVLDNYITKDMDCVLEDFYNGWFSQNGTNFYKTEINNIFSSRSVFYSTPSFTRGPIFTKIDGRLIPDGTGESLNSILNITDNLSIRNMNVFVDLPHKYKADLLVTLISPSGKEVILHNYQYPLSGQSQDIFAWYQPPYETIPAESLDRFKGENSQGNWTLRITDPTNHNLMEDNGILNCWKIEIMLNTPSQVGTITPSSGSSAAGTAVNFTTTYSDPDGWQDIQYVHLLINTAVNGKNCFYGYYNQNSNKLYLRNDANTAWLGGYAPGSSNVIQNSYAKLNCAQTSVTGSDTILTVNWSVTFKSTFAGTQTKNTYLYVKDDANANSGWTKKGTWTITNQTPTVGTVSPSSGTSNPNQTITFTTTYTDPNGWQDIQYGLFLINTAVNGANCFYGQYSQNGNKLYIRDDANTAWLGGYAPGSSNIIENSYAKLDCSQTTVSGSGTTLTVKWSVTFKSSFTGIKNTYLRVVDDANANSGWAQKGAWLVETNPNPSVGSISPSSGSSLPDTPVTFTTTYSDPDGWQDIQYGHLLINTAVNGKSCFYGYYNQNGNKLYIRDDANTAWLGGFTPGSANIIENSYAKLNCASTTVSGSANTLTVKWSVTFKSSFAGTQTKNTYLYVKDDSNANSGWAQKGTWLVGTNSNPTVGTISPSSGSSPPNTPVTFTTTYTDPNGWQNIQYGLFLINTAINGANSFYGYYNLNTNKLYLRNDANTAWLGGYAPGSNNSIENSYAKLDCSKTTVSGSGTTLTVKWSVTFKSSFTGIKNTYLRVVDDANNADGFIQKGDFCIFIIPIPPLS